MSAPIMNVRDTVSGSQGECVVVIDGRRYNFMILKSINATMEKKKDEVAIMGKTGASNKTVGWSGSGSMTFYYNWPVFRRLMKRFKDTGQDFYFDVIIRNADLASSAGAQTVILKDCNSDSIELAKLDADSTTLEEDMDFTFDDWENPEEFTELAGM